MTPPSLPCLPVELADHPRATAPRAIPSEALFKLGQEVVIDHEGQRYRLRVTRQNKLILTK